jgi:hypothetical protein
MQRTSANRLLTYTVLLILAGSLFSVVLPAFKPSFGSHLPVWVNVSGDDVDDSPYGIGDSVAIEGFVDDVVENEDVIISFKEPSGLTEDEVNYGEPGSSNNFDAVLEIPNGADGGAWSVEAEYDGEFAYTYFLVEFDEDEVDEIFLTLDNPDRIYEAGDEVTILGAVNEDPAEDTVNIQVFDPTSDTEIVDQDVELDGDEFDFSFDLENDASHGRYAVRVTYDIDDQEGAILFEIEDDDSGSSTDEGCSGGDEDTVGDLTAKLEADTYAPSDTVCLSGTIDGYDSGDNEDLEIEVQDPDDEVVDDYSDATTTVENNGDFEYEFNLNDDAPEGTYTVTLTYVADEVVLTFDVEDTSGNGGSDGVSGTSGDLTAEIDKGSFLAGDSIAVSGSVDELKEDADDEPEKVIVLLYRPNGVVILAASKFVTPSSNGDFSTNVVLDTDYDLEVDDDYWVTVTYVDDEVRLSFDITGVSSSPSPGSEITVQTDDDVYDLGSTVEITGEVPESMIVEGTQILIRVNKPDGNPCRIDPIDLPSDGSYTYDLVLGGVCSVNGQYEVEVNYGGEQATTSFELQGGSSELEYNLTVDDRTFPIKYDLSDGSITNMFARQAENKLVIIIDADDDGQLTVELPRQVIDAIENGEDINYIVSIEDASGNVETVEIEESDNTDSTRTLVIDYPAGGGRIEILGTQVVPEFGSAAIIMMVVATVGIILLTSRFSSMRNFSVFRQ